MATFLIVERLGNWEVDHKNNFQVLGVSGRGPTMFRQMSAGDKLISYIASGISKFADVRERLDSEVHATRRFGELGYSDPYPFYVKTKSVLSSTWTSNTARSAGAT